MTRRAMRQHGLAALEFAIVLPLLLLIFMFTFDFASAINAQLVLSHLSREGATLAARSAFAPAQQILGSLAASASPLDLAQQGTLQLTRVVGINDGTGVRAVALEQTRWSGGLPPADSDPSIWRCGEGGLGPWDSNGRCAAALNADPGARTAAFDEALTEGQTIYVLEASYRFKAAFGLIDLSPNLRVPGLTSQLLAVSAL